MIISKSIYVAANIMPLIFYPKRDEMWSGPWIPSISHNFQGDLWHGRRLAQRILINMTNLGFPVGLQSKKSACNAGDMGLIPGWGRSPGEGNDYPLEYCCLDNSMDSPMDCSLPCVSVHGTLQARIVERVAIPFSRGSSSSRDQTQVSHISRRFFPCEPPEKPQMNVRPGPSRLGVGGWPP